MGFNRPKNYYDNSTRLGEVSLDFGARKSRMAQPGRSLESGLYRKDWWTSGVENSNCQMSLSHVSCCCWLYVFLMLLWLCLILCVWFVFVYYHLGLLFPNEAGIQSHWRTSHKNCMQELTRPSSPEISTLVEVGKVLSILYV